jgi:hypothetical protein
MAGGLRIERKNFFFEKKAARRGKQKTFMSLGPGRKTVRGQTNKSLFGSFSSEKELLTELVIFGGVEY